VSALKHSSVRFPLSHFRGGGDDRYNSEAAADLRKVVENMRSSIEFVNR